MKEKQTTNIKGAAESPEDAKRERSTISFPYGDLDNAIKLVKAIHEYGGRSCTLDQLAAALGQSAKGGAFNQSISYPRIFGLTELERGEISLTELGSRIVDAPQEAQARVDAFLTVPLYKAIYEKYKGYSLPPPAALEREIQSLGVSSKQTDKARQVFERSAKQAGFFNMGADRLVIPPLKGRPDTKPLGDNGDSNKRNNGGGNGGSGSDEFHPFIQGLLKTLPPPNTVWAEADRKKWVITAEGIFGLIYKEA